MENDKDGSTISDDKLFDYEISGDLIKLSYKGVPVNKLHKRPYKLEVTNEKRKGLIYVNLVKFDENSKCLPHYAPYQCSWGPCHVPPGRR